jgi:hypothetical protein
MGLGINWGTTSGLTILMAVLPAVGVLGLLAWFAWRVWLAFVSLD